MTKPPPITERTAAGLQYVIPGTERRVPPRPVRYPRDGAQFVIPGAERIGYGELLKRRMAQKLLPRRGQRPAQTTPLFRFSGFVAVCVLVDSISAYSAAAGPVKKFAVEECHRLMDHTFSSAPEDSARFRECLKDAADHFIVAGCAEAISKDMIAKYVDSPYPEAESGDHARGREEAAAERRMWCGDQ